ncbi:MAG TPA: methyltransferase domain-containing protein [Terriglobales bacterium]
MGTNQQSYQAAAPHCCRLRLQSRVTAMITHSEDYVEYCRQTAASARDLHDLALRGRDKHQVTRLIHERIAREVGLGPGDDVVDIGCGDGTLLRMASVAGAGSAIGMQATEQEAALVRRLGFDVRQGLSDSLPLPDNCASVVVCNSVFPIIPRDRVEASLREISRIARPGARIYLGEVPFAPGPAPEPRFNTAQETLSYLYRKYGFRTWCGMARRMAYWKLTGKPMVIYHGRQISFHAQPEEFIAMAESVGLTLVRYWQHEHIKTRNNYLLRRPVPS